MKKFTYVAAAFMAMTACNNNPFFSEWDTPYGIPPFDKIKVADYLPAVEAGIAEQNADIQAIIDNPEAPDFENTIAALDRSGALLSKVAGVLFNVSESDASDEINAVVEKARPLISEHSDNMWMKEAL